MKAEDNTIPVSPSSSYRRYTKRIIVIIITTIVAFDVTACERTF